MFLFLLILGLQARLKNGKRALADKWYVNEGDIDVTIPCEMDIGKLMTTRSDHLSPDRPDVYRRINNVFSHRESEKC